MARNHSRGRSRAPRRLTQWIGISGALSSVDASSVLVASLNATALELRPFTVMRTYLQVLMGSDQLAMNELQVGAVGMCVVSQAASAAGVASVPTPITELDSDFWFLHQLMLGTFTFLDATGFESAADRAYSPSSKAMRRVDNDSDVILVAEGDTLGDGMTITTIGRMLIKLH